MHRRAVKAPLLPHHSTNGLACEEGSGNGARREKDPYEKHAKPIRRGTRTRRRRIILFFGLAFVVSLSFPKVRKPVFTRLKRLNDYQNAMWMLGERIGYIENPPQFDPMFLDDYPFLEILQDNWIVFREEILAVDRDAMPPLGQVLNNKVNKFFVANWKSLMLILSGSNVEENRHYAPRTLQLLETARTRAAASNSDIVQAFFSSLEPGTTLNPHWGYYKGYRRFLLPLVVPGHNNSKHDIYLRASNTVEKVNNMPLAERTALLDAGIHDNTTAVCYFHEGVGVMFDDTRLHEVHNANREGARIVLFVDVLRKLPWMADRYNRFVNWIINVAQRGILNVRQRAILKPIAMPQNKK